MRKSLIIFSSLFLFGMLFYSCSTDVDLYADYKDITVVYGLLDSGQDTNFIKINKAFLGPGNAFEIALIDDSCNYPGKLDAKLIEFRANAMGHNYQQTRVLPLDTITVHNKDLGIFYAPDQLIYYTKERIYSNTDHYNYKYELQIDRGDTILKSTTEMVGGYGFTIATAMGSFAAPDATPIKFYPCPNAAIYEVVLKFRFTEVSSSLDSVERCMTWSLGTYSEEELKKNMEQGRYVVSHKSSLFYTSLASFLGNDTLNQSVDRVVKDNSLCVSIAAGGYELYNFISVNGPSSSIVQNIPEYTNIIGGYGVFSSRTMKEKWINMNSINNLMDRHENWRFRQG